MGRVRTPAVGRSGGALDERALTFKLDIFKEEDTPEVTQQFGWTLIDDSNQQGPVSGHGAPDGYELFLQTGAAQGGVAVCRRQGPVKLSDIVTYFRKFYEARRAGLVVEKANSITPRRLPTLRPSGISSPILQAV